MKTIASEVTNYIKTKPFLVLNKVILNRLLKLVSICIPPLATK